MQKLRKILLIIVLLNLSPQIASAQNAELKNAIIEINRFLTSAKFYKIRLQNGELAAIDTLYVSALKFLKYDYSEALLSLTFALLPFEEMKLHDFFALHLPRVEQPLFEKRLESLPSNFLPDSPGNRIGDTDKLSHFFGNSFVSYNLIFFDIANFLGIFVESFELNFKVEGAFDERDLAVNRLGIIFGKALKKNKNTLPSEIIALYSLTFIGTP